MASESLLKGVFLDFNFPVLTLDLPCSPHSIKDSITFLIRFQLIYGITTPAFQIDYHGLASTPRNYPLKIVRLALSYFR
jgi:hypothetical protein